MHGQPFEYAGRHYQVRPTDFMLPDPPVQRPHPPVWVVGAGAHRAGGLVRTPSLDRAARWDGLLPNVIGETGPGDTGSPESLAAVVELTRARREAAGLRWDGLRRRSPRVARTAPDRTDPGDPADVGRRGSHLVGRGRLGPGADGRRRAASWTGGSRPGRRRPSLRAWR